MAVQHNNFGNAGAQALAETLRESHSLTSLKLGVRLQAIVVAWGEC